MADLVDAVRVRKPNEPAELQDLYFPAKQEVTGPNGGRVPVDIGSATVNLNGDVIAEFDGVEEALGAPADAAASSDSATTGLIGLVKRLLGKLPSSFQQGSGAVTAATTRVTLATDGPGVTGINSIDGKLPALSSGAVPVAPAVQLGSGVMTATTQRITLATDGPTVSTLTSIDTKTPSLVNGRQPVESFTPARTPTTTSVASSATSVTILASNANRRGLSISNVSTSKLYLSFSGTATVANSWIEVPAGAFLLLDQQLIVTNAITGIWASANGTAQVTEYV